MKSSVCFKKILVFLILGCHALFAQTTLPAQSYTFYFLPPNDEKWIAGNSYLYNGDDGTVEIMQIDTTRCGWFTKKFSSLERVPEKVLIYLGSQGRDKLDSTGKGADLSNQAWISLRGKFGVSPNLFLDADKLVYTATDPMTPPSDDKSRCSYKIAAFIYDTDNAVNASFSGRYVAPTENGIRRGLVKATLDTIRVVGTDTLRRKPTFARAAVPYANWQDAESFTAAFTPYGKYKGKVTNVPRCYDMPFGRVASGTWEFDSDRTRTPTGNNLVGGFYPYILDSAYTVTTAEDYTSCPECRREYQADCFNLLSNTQLANLTPVTYKGITYTGVEAFNRTYFPDGAGYHTYYGNTRGCTTPSPGYSNTTKARANLSFCFESHGEFTYEQGQEFFFRGDDDIWVFINNKLVIDLGGIHMPAPGFVDLDSIKNPALVPGDKYPIDIFFCERMGTQSNVRVSTNMYITQKSSFYNNLERDKDWMCVSRTSGGNCAEQISIATGGSGKRQDDFCGSALIDSMGLAVQFYMIKRGDVAEIPLSGTSPNCKGDGTTFACFEKEGIADGGIKVDRAVYSCGGRGKCSGNASAVEKVNVPIGSYTVYSRLVDASGKPYGDAKPLVIDEIKSSTAARLVWGTLNGTTPLPLKDAYGATTKKEQYIIAGKRTPIYISRGSWRTNGNVIDTSYTSFIFDSESENEVKYTLPGIAGLIITLDSLGEKEVTASTWPRTLPASGIDTLWVMGDFDIGGEKEFLINLEGISNNEETPSLKLTVYPPQLRFTTDTNFVTPINPATPNRASGYTRWISRPDEVPYVGKALDVYVVAWDSYTVNGKLVRDTICGHCNFSLRTTSTTNNDSINKIYPNNIVQSDSSSRLKNGKQAVYIRGRAAVEGADTAQWRIYYGSVDYIFAEWTGLQFRNAPIPMPLISKVFDRNGDGIGDSLVIQFSKSFKNKSGIVESSLLPILIDVVWEKGFTVTIGNPKYGDNLRDRAFVLSHYDSTFFAENFEYWKNYLTGDSVITIADPNTVFSKGILTSGKGSLSSYTPFYDEGECKTVPCSGSPLNNDAFKYKKEEVSVIDGISPIVVKAEYKYDSDNFKDCSQGPPGCNEKLVVYLSEPVFAAPNAADNTLKNPFNYCFEYSQGSNCETAFGKIPPKPVSQTDNTLNWDWRLSSPEPNSSLYKPKTKKDLPKIYYEGVTASSGDSIVELNYESYVGRATPKATDWVKIRPPSPANGVFYYDVEGNTANPRELGVLISGENVFSKEQVKIAVIDPTISPEDEASIIGGTFAGKRDLDAYYPTWITGEAKSYARNLFKFEDKYADVTEFLPVPNTVPDTAVKYYFPGSVGTLFKIGHNFYNEAFNIWGKCEKTPCYVVNSDGIRIPVTKKEDIAKGITMHASVYYHTNLGDYAAHRDPIVARCTDLIFQGPNTAVSEFGNNCAGNEYNLYLAWDLKTNKNRFVGTGVYVAITKFYWQVKYGFSGGEEITEKFDKSEFVEMFGVRRGK